jgi:hypothetical protein
MEKFLYIQSNESNDYFSDNRACKFKVHLDVPLTFNGFWKVGLVDIRDKQIWKLLNTECLYVYSSLCKESIVQGSEQPILRRVKPNVIDGWDYIFDSPIYLPLKKKEVREFEIYIKSGDMSFPSFLDSPVNLTLHFKRYPFYADYESL